MPTISVNRDELFRRLGRTYTEKEFDDLCFEFGIELDEVTSEQQFKAKEAGGVAAGEKKKADENEEVIYRIEIPANRYDLLCIEGLARALNIFLGRQPIPNYRLTKTEKPLQFVVLPATKKVRPFIVGAVLRNVKFTPASYASFIDLQDKLHQNICRFVSIEMFTFCLIEFFVYRKRALAAIGTHDLDTVKGPFFYNARRPEDIKFVPLKQTKEFNGRSLMELYSTDDYFKQYIPIIRDCPEYPVITDSNNVVLSLPPVVNGEHSRIKLTTTNVLIECTATDLQKASIVLDTMVTMFAEYCQQPFEVEPVEVVQVDKSKAIFPKLAYRKESITVDYINRNLGINVNGKQVVEFLKRMSLEANQLNDDQIEVIIPPVRHDILHACDILEDVGIAFGYNNIRLVLPRAVTIGGPFELNRLSDKLREEVARCGYTEVLTFCLVSAEDIGAKMRTPEVLEQAVKVANPKTVDFQVARTTLVSSLLRTLASNKKMPLPLKLFELSDVVFKDDTKGEFSNVYNLY